MPKSLAFSGVRARPITLSFPNSSIAFWAIARPSWPLALVLIVFF